MSVMHFAVEQGEKRGMVKGEVKGKADGTQYAIDPFCKKRTCK